ncbi:MAG: LytTR family transcriptional regulator [Rudanella sp.]|nr:LytTR family transcriptional regulator [Rudanella sp.]
MNRKLAISYHAIQNRKAVLLTTILLACVGLTIALDFLEARFQHSSFDLSESFFFSSFWWLFLPFLYGQLAFVKVHTKTTAVTLGTLLPIATHLCAFPAIVWLLSTLFYHHSFDYWQTFQFGLTEHFFKLLLVYTLPLSFDVLFDKRIPSRKTFPTNLAIPDKKDFVTSFIVTEGNKRISIETKDIVFFTANPPYVNIHHQAKKYLYNGTLKSIIAKVDGDRFVRVHKFAIINLAEVQSYRSRLNGDYDLTMNDGSQLRLSRNYAKAFKLKFGGGPQYTTI